MKESPLHIIIDDEAAEAKAIQAGVAGFMRDRMSKTGMGSHMLLKSAKTGPAGDAELFSLFPKQPDGEAEGWCYVSGPYPILHTTFLQAIKGAPDCGFIHRQANPLNN